MKWQHPPIIKIYEALGAVADGRVQVDGNMAKVYSSSGNKFYEVSYDSEKKMIMANDDGSYWRGYLGYPAIAYLLKEGIFSYNERFGNMFKGVAWKDINQKFKNDFDKALEHILSSFNPSEVAEIDQYVRKIDRGIRELDLSFLGEKALPPEGY